MAGLLLQGEASFNLEEDAKAWEQLAVHLPDPATDLSHLVQGAASSPLGYHQAV